MKPKTLCRCAAILLALFAGGAEAQNMPAGAFITTWQTQNVGGVPSVIIPPH